MGGGHTGTRWHGEFSASSAQSADTDTISHTHTHTHTKCQLRDLREQKGAKEKMLTMFFGFVF